MLTIPNGCNCSTPSVYPKNWQSKKAKTDFDWHISYRFYDPTYRKPKQVLIKGMNRLKNLSDRQEATRSALSSEISKLVKEGHNPFCKGNVSSNKNFNIDGFASILTALQYANNNLEVSDRTKMDLKYALLSVKKAISSLSLTNRDVESKIEFPPNEQNLQSKNSLFRYYLS